MSVEAAVIRADRPDDRESLLDLLEMAMRETYPDLDLLTRSQFRERLEAEFAHYMGVESRAIWVAEVEGKVAGCLWAMESFHPVTGMPDLFVVNVAIFPDFQGRGLARKLFAEAVDLAKKKRIPVVRLFVNPRNEAAYKLYLQLGFEPQTHEMRLSLT